MSQQEPKQSYIFQPFGTQLNINQNNPRKFYGISIHEKATTGSIYGLTKNQAERILSILQEPNYPVAE